MNPTFQEILPLIHADYLVLHFKAKTSRRYIQEIFPEKDYPRLSKDFGSVAVMRADFYLDPPEIYLDDHDTDED